MFSKANQFARRVAASRRNSGTRRITMEQLEDRRVLSASLQVIHNSPYDAASVVDVYVDDALALDNLEFRDATGFIDLPSDTPLKIDIKGPESTDSSPAVFSTNVTLEDGTNYVAMAVGDPAGTEGQPAFQLALTDMGQKAATDAGNVDFTVFHGSPDAPTVDILGRDVATLVDDIAYPEFADSYLSVPPATYTIDVTPGDDNNLVVASFEANLSDAAGTALIVAASGFLNPPAETDPGFGLLAVFSDGATALLPSVDVPSAQLQVIHNSPYASASVVDVYVNDELFLDDLAFQDATPFVSVPANVDLVIDITGADAADNGNPVFSTTANLKSTSYVAIAIGDPVDATDAPAFTLAVTDMGRTEPEMAENVEFLVFHGAPDAPPVDIIAQGVGTLVDDISFGEYADDYLSVPPAPYILDITPADNNEQVVVSFHADLSQAGGNSLVVSASGFLQPNTQDDAVFTLLAAFADGSTALIPRNVPDSLLPGDANGDGQFDQFDIMQVLQAGKYQTSQPAKFSEGDWNNDGVFDQFDLIDALTNNTFVHALDSVANDTAAVDQAMMDPNVVN